MIEAVGIDSAGVYFCSVELFGGDWAKRWGIGSRSAEPSTVAEAVSRFTSLGYVGDFQAKSEGLWDTIGQAVFRPEMLQIDALFRFEGESDPADGAIVFALSDLAGSRQGTYVVAFGAQTEREDASAISRLRDARYASAVTTPKG